MIADRFLWSRLVIGDACYQRLKRAATRGSGGSSAFLAAQLSEVLQILLREVEQIVALSFDQKQSVGSLNQVELKLADALRRRQDLFPLRLTFEILNQ